MTTRVVASVDIDASTDAVWQVLEAIEAHVEWMSDAERITFRTATRRGVGTEFECVTRLGPFRTTDVIRITDWVPGELMGIEHQGMVTGRGELRIEPLAANRTRVHWDETLRFPARLGGRLGAALARPVLEHIWRANLVRLRALVEAPIPG